MASSNSSFPTLQNQPGAAIPVWQAAEFYYNLNAATTGYQVYTGTGCLVRLLA